MEKEKDKQHIINYSVNGDPQTTDQKELTPIEIMKQAGVDPDANYLIELQGNHQDSYKEKPTEKIKMHNNMKFITNFIGPTEVS